MVTDIQFTRQAAADSFVAHRSRHEMLFFRYEIRLLHYVSRVKGERQHGNETARKMDTDVA